MVTLLEQKNVIILLLLSYAYVFPEVQENGVEKHTLEREKYMKMPDCSI